MDSSDIIKEEANEVKEIIDQIIEEEFERTGNKLDMEDPIVLNKLFSYIDLHSQEIWKRAVKRLKEKEEPVNESETNEGEVQDNL